jgi:hypothetical protein
VIGYRSEHRGEAVHRINICISDEIALLVNEVFYDLLYKERILTPGFNRDNLVLPWVHVSDMNKLEQML